MRRSIALIMLAIVAISSFAFIPNLASADTQFQGLWLRLRGVITQWGTTPVFGWIGIHTAMVNVNNTYHEKAMVHAIWTNEPPRLNCSERPSKPENFTFTCYAAKLIETLGIKLNLTEGKLDIAGLWNVIKITTTITIIVNQNGWSISFAQTFEPVVTNATGALHVFDHLTKFALGIEGIDLLSGFILGGIFKYVEIKLCDINDDGKVDLRELVAVARRFRTVPGLWNYNHDMDFNGDNIIDMGDLTTVAANIT